MRLIVQDEGRFGLLGTPPTPRRCRCCWPPSLSGTTTSSSSCSWTDPDGTSPATCRSRQTCASFCCRPTAPELNPAEHFWEALHEDWFANTAFHELDAVEDALNDGLIALESDPQRVQTMTGFNWITSI